MENIYINSLMKLEGDKKEFKYRGFRCLIKRHKRLGHLCGYIELPKHHNLYGVDYDEIEETYDYELPVHGGLTFSGRLVGEDGYLIGFDCAHAGDYIPLDPLSSQLNLGETYRTMRYVEDMLKEMVDFITEYEGGD